MNAMMKAAGLATIGVLVGYGSWYIGKNESPAVTAASTVMHSQPRPSSDTHITAMQPELANLRKMVETLNRESFATQAKPAAGNTAEKADVEQLAAKETPSPELQAQRDEEHRVQQLQTLENRITLESRDQEWSSPNETLLRSGFAQVTEQMSVSEVKCASSLCRVTGNMTEHGNPGEIYRTITEKVQWAGETHLTMDPGTGQVIAYLGRPGIPLVEQEALDLARQGSE